MNLRELIQFANSLIKGKVNTVSSEQEYFDAIESNEGNILMLLITDKQQPPVLYSVISDEFESKPISFLMAKQNSFLANKFGVRNFPALFFLSEPYSFKGIKFEGELKREAIREFIKPKIL